MVEPAQKAPAEAPPEAKPADQKVLPVYTKVKRNLFGYDPAKATQKATRKAMNARSKQAAKDAKNLAGPSMYAELEETKTLCEKYRKGIASLDADEAIEVIKKLYLHMTNSRLDKPTTSSLYDILERLYLRKDVLARVTESNDPVIAKGLRPFMDGVISRSAEKALVPPAGYIQLVRKKPDMLKLENDQIIRMARIIGKGQTDPIAVINKTFGVAEITLPEHAALMLELNSKNIILRSAVVAAYNELADRATTFLGGLATNDPATRRVLEEMNKVIASGKATSADEAIVGIFKNEAFREDMRKILGPGSKPMLDELAKASTLKELEAVVRGVGTEFTAPNTATSLITALNFMGKQTEFIGTLEARRILDQSTTEIANAIRAANLDRAKFARGLLPGMGETVESGARGVYALGKLGASPIAVPAGMALEELGEARVPVVRPRRILRGAGYGLAAVGMGFLGFQAIKYFTWGRTAREREAARELLEKTWGVSITLDTANKMKSPVAENFFTNWFEFGRSTKLASDLVPKTEKQLNELLKTKGFYINPARINDLAAAVDAQIKTMKQQGKSDSEIAESLDSMARGETGDWRKKGFFLTAGELFMESFGRELNLTRELTDYLKATVLSGKNTELFTLLWAGMRDGSLPRTFAADVALEVFTKIGDETMNASGKTEGQLVLERIQEQLEKRKTFSHDNLPSVRDSLAQAGITSEYLLSTPIPPGSLIDFYDQYAASSHDEKVEMRFKTMLEQYRSDPEAAKRLNAFVLRPGEEVYGDVPTIVRRVAEGTLSLDAARAQHTVSDEIFARLNVFDKGLVAFVYQNSDEKGNGMLKWLKSNANSIKNGTEMIKRFQANRGLFIGKTSEGTKDKPGTSQICDQLTNELLQSYVKEEQDRAGWTSAGYRGAKSLLTGKPPAPLPERWYVRTAEPFMSWTPRDVVPREAGVVGKPTPVVNVESEALLREKLGVVLFPSKNEARFSPQDKRVRDTVFNSVRDKALASDAGSRKSLADAGVTTEEGPVGIVINVPEPDDKKYAAFQKFVGDASKAESDLIAVESVLNTKVAAVLRSEDPALVAKVVRTIANTVVGANDKQRATLSDFGIKVTEGRKGLAVKVPQSTEAFQRFVNGLAEKARK